MTVLAILLGSMLLGWLLRNARVPHLPGRTLSAIVWVLLFLFGCSIGANPEIISNLHAYGIRALLLAAAGALGSALAALGLRKLANRRSKR